MDCARALLVDKVDSRARRGALPLIAHARVELYEPVEQLDSRGPRRRLAGTTSLPRAVSALAAATDLPRPHRRSRRRDPHNGTRLTALAWTLPPGWHAVEPRPTAVVEPMHATHRRLVRPAPDAPDRTCSPETARRQLPPRRRRRVPPRVPRPAGSPPRPARFRLGRAGSARVLGRGTTVAWTEQGRALQAVVMLGERAGASPGARPRRYSTRWSCSPSRRLRRPRAGATSSPASYDSMRVPPGWSARALSARSARRVRGCCSDREPGWERGRAGPRAPPWAAVARVPAGARAARVRRAAASGDELSWLPVLDADSGAARRERARPRMGGDQRP